MNCVKTKGISINELSEQYNKGTDYLRRQLCRSEFNKFMATPPLGLINTVYYFDNSPTFHETLSAWLNKKKKL